VKFKGSFVTGHPSHGTAMANLALLTQGANEPSTGSGPSDPFVSSTDKHLDEGRPISKTSHTMPHQREQNSEASRAVDSVNCTQRKADAVFGEQQAPRREFLPRAQVWTE
jgi:hypothetical protein